MSLGGLQSWSGCNGEEESLYLYQEWNTTIDPTACHYTDCAFCFTVHETEKNIPDKTYEDYNKNIFCFRRQAAVARSV
jgi:hypothetical protein